MIYNNINRIIKESSSLYNNSVGGGQIVNIDSKFENKNGIVRQVYEQWRWVKLDTSKLITADRVSDIQLRGYVYPYKVKGLRCTFFAQISGNRGSGYSTQGIDKISNNIPPISVGESLGWVALYPPSPSGSGTVSTTITVDKVWDEAYYLGFGAYGHHLQSLISRSVDQNSINIKTNYNGGSGNVVTTTRTTDIYILTNSQI